jgi:predicted ribosome quality control (RQC) complex YloA/Tae2 family protein
MIIDNLIVNALKKEFLAKLNDGRIEKVYQPDKDSFLVQIWSRNKIYKLLISLNPNSYRACITTKNYKIPKQYSPFCLQIKKALESGYITAIEQLNFDRILVFKIAAFDNVKDKVNFNLIIELTGKYGNLILTDDELRVIACYKQIDESQNEERQILVGHPYHPITNKSAKTHLAELNRDKFNKLVLSFPEHTVKKFLVNNFLGISSHTAGLILNNNNLANKQISYCSTEELNLVFAALADFTGKVKTDNLAIEMIKPDTGKNSLDFRLAEHENHSFISGIIDDYYDDLANKNTFDLLQKELKKVTEKNIIKVQENINRLQDNLKSAGDSEIYKEYGDLLLANIHSLKDKMPSVTLENFYNENIPVNIILDENLSISENAQKFFKIYNKAKNTRFISAKRLEDFIQEMEYLEEVDISLNLAENLEDLKETEAELENEKYLTTKKNPARKTKGPDKNNLLAVTSSDGLEILIGKNNSQNDFLTTKLATANDIWLHTRLIPGSHVVIRTSNGQKQVSEKTLQEAAFYAAKYSKAKYSSNVCVIYTKIKFVKKPPRSKPGFVIYSNEKAVFVTPS